ncbi:MAG: hypothetical protein HY841_14790 [Bacteroidetes bacterium]|nr:hypothetical protein [Bacteroidota bacterium]
MITTEAPQTNGHETRYGAERPKNPAEAGSKTPTISQQMEELKSKLNEAGKEAKENIRSTINACTEQYNRAIEANKKYVNDLRGQMKESGMDTSHLDEISNTIANALQLSEEVIDTIIDSHLSRVNQLVDFNKKSVELLQQAYISDKFNYEKFIALQQKNFEQCMELSVSDMNKTAEVYNKHINLSVNFNRNFSRNINSQIDTLVKFQTQGLQTYNKWISNLVEQD